MTLEAWAFDGRLIIHVPVEVPQILELRILGVAIKETNINPARKPLVGGETSRSGGRTFPAVSGNRAAMDANPGIAAPGAAAGIKVCRAI